MLLESFLISSKAHQLINQETHLEWDKPLRAWKNHMNFSGKNKFEV